ncbi:MAG: MarR family transcriptional regulator [Nitrososphaera sp.]|jgi:small subunit ribosomal protein S25e
MGGNKKKPTGASDKTAQTGPGGAEIKQASEKKAAKPQQKQKLSVLVEESVGMKAIQGMKAITPQAVARNIGVKISVANGFIRSLEQKGVVKSVGGYSGHRVYQLMTR